MSLCAYIKIALKTLARVQQLHDAKTNNIHRLFNNIQGNK